MECEVPHFFVRVQIPDLPKRSGSGHFTDDLLIHPHAVFFVYFDPDPVLSSMARFLSTRTTFRFFSIPAFCQGSIYTFSFWS